jgi:hypothetical protein
VVGSALAGGEGLDAIATLEPAGRRDYAVGVLALLGGMRDPWELGRELARL